MTVDMAKMERLLRMQLRALAEKSNAMPQRYYGDPARHIKFEREKQTPPTTKGK